MMPTKDLTNDILKGIMVDAMVMRDKLPIGTDLNTVLKSGIYPTYLELALQNLPPKVGSLYGILEVVNSGYYVLQRYYACARTDGTSTIFAWRMSVTPTGESWLPWICQSNCGFLT